MRRNVFPDGRKDCSKGSDSMYRVYAVIVFLCVLFVMTVGLTEKTKAEQVKIIFTKEEKEFIENAGEVTIAFIPNRSPMSGKNEDGEIEGITVDIVRLIEERSGLTFHYTMLQPGERSVEYLREHPKDMIAGVLSENKEFADEGYLLTENIYSDDVALVCKEGMDYDVDAGDNTYRLAIPRSYAALEHYVKERYPQFEVIFGATTREAVAMVERGEADMAAQNVRVLEPILSSPQFENITVVPTYFLREHTAIVSLASEENKLLTGIINKCIDTISETEISQFTVDHTVSSIYRMTWSDVLYKYRYPIIAIAILSVAVFLLMWALHISRKRYYLKLEVKNKELAEAVERADRANAAKGRFLAKMSHEIRTPLNTIITLTALAKKKKEVPENLKQDVKKIQVSGDLLLSVINDVLDVSAIEMEKMKLTQELFNIQELVSSIAMVYEAECSQKGILFHLEMQMRDVYVVGDAIRVQQILMNLLSNACKFTQEGGRIDLFVNETMKEGQRACYIFKIKDDGEGMTEEMQQRLFLPFEQEEAGTYHKYGGSGLGLSIVKSLTELMQGTVTCESEKGKGTTFTVELSLEIAPEEMQQKMQGKDVGERKLAETPEETYDFGGRTILLAEDTEMNAEIMMDLLELVNLKTVWAKDGEEAVKLFEASAKGEYFAVLMDVNMPRMNGYEAAKAIRASKHPEGKNIPIFAMTANAFEEDVTAAKEAGMNEHIAKPVDIDLLYGLLAKFLQK